MYCWKADHSPLPSRARHTKRLEFIGDGILASVVRKLIYLRFPDLANEGIVTVANHLCSNDLLGHLYDVCGVEQLRLQTAAECWDRGRQRGANRLGWSICETTGDVIPAPFSPSPPPDGNSQEEEGQQQQAPLPSPPPPPEFAKSRSMPRPAAFTHLQKADSFEALCAAIALDSDVLVVGAWLESLLEPWLQRVELHPRLKDDRFLTAAAISRRRAAAERERERQQSGVLKVQERAEQLEMGLVAGMLRRASRPLVSLLFPEINLPQKDETKSSQRKLS